VNAYPVDETTDTDVRALSLGQVKSLSHELLNPSYLAFQKQKTIGISVYSRYGMKELGTKSLFGMIPNDLIATGFKLSSYGYDDYQLLQGQISLAKKIFPNFSIGTGILYLRENSILEERNKHYLLADIGLFWQINDAFEWTFSTENLLYTMNSNRTFFCTGILYRLLSSCNLLLEIRSDTSDHSRISAGIEYEITEEFTVRGGFLSDPQTPSIGLGYLGKPWKLDVGFMLHPTLGLSSAIGVGCFF
jgi:hypothetical protein